MMIQNSRLFLVKNFRRCIDEAQSESDKARDSHCIDYVAMPWKWFTTNAVQQTLEGILAAAAGGEDNRPVAVTCQVPEPRRIENRTP